MNDFIKSLIKINKKQYDDEHYCNLLYNVNEVKLAELNINFA